MLLAETDYTWSLFTTTIGAVVASIVLQLYKMYLDDRREREKILRDAALTLQTADVAKKVDLATTALRQDTNQQNVQLDKMSQQTDGMKTDLVNAVKEAAASKAIVEERDRVAAKQELAEARADSARGETVKNGHDEPPQPVVVTNPEPVPVTVKK